MANASMGGSNAAGIEAAGSPKNNPQPLSITVPNNLDAANARPLLVCDSPAGTHGTEDYS